MAHNYKFVGKSWTTDLCRESKSQCLHLCSWAQSQVKPKAVHADDCCFLKNYSQHGGLILTSRCSIYLNLISKVNKVPVRNLKKYIITSTWMALHLQQSDFRACVILSPPALKRDIMFGAECAMMSGLDFRYSSIFTLGYKEKTRRKHC